MSTDQLIGPPPAVASFPFAPGSDRGTIEDLYLYLDRPARPPLRLGEVGSLSSSSSATGVSPLIVEDAASVVVFDTREATYTSRAWGGGFDLHTWRRGFERLTVLTRSGVDPSAPVGSRLDERVWGRATPSVRTLIVNGVEISSGRVVLKAGYNLAASVAGEAVTLGAVPGAGAGQYRDCGPGAVPVKTINRAGPSASGAFSLTAADCLSVTASAEAESALTVSGDCRPCLDCDDLVRVYKALKQADAAGAALGARRVAVTEQYNAGVERWNSQKECREAHPTRAVVSPYKSAGSTCAVLMIAHGNTTAYCQADAFVTLSWSSPVIGEYLPGSGLIYLPNGQTRGTDPTGTWPNYSFAWGSIDPGRSARVRASFCFPGGVPGQTATLTATTIVAGEVVGTSTTTVTFS